MGPLGAGHHALGQGVRGLLRLRGGHHAGLVEVERALNQQLALVIRQRNAGDQAARAYQCLRKRVVELGARTAPTVST